MMGDSWRACAGEAAVRLWAAGPADVEMERAGASEYMALLTAAGTYTIKATLDGNMLPGMPLIKPPFASYSSLSKNDSIADEDSFAQEGQRWAPAAGP